MDRPRTSTSMALAVWAALLCVPALAAAADIAIVTGASLPAAVSVVHGFQKDIGQPCIQYELALDQANAEFIQRSLRRQAPKLVVAVGPRAAKLAQLTLPDVPLVCALVEDPARLRLGTANMAWLGSQVRAKDVALAARALAPRARSLGLVTSSPDSRWEADLAQEAAAVGLTLQVLATKSESQVGAQLKRAVESCDVLWYAQDPVCASPASFEFARRLCLERHVPMMVFSDALARAGGVMSLSPSYEAMGSQLARLARRSLADALTPGPVALDAAAATRTLNVTVANQLGLLLPSNLSALAEQILR